MLFQKALLTNGYNATRGDSAGDGFHYFQKESGMVLVDKGDYFEYFHISGIPYGNNYKVKINKDAPFIDWKDIGKNVSTLKIVSDSKSEGKPKK